MDEPTNDRDADATRPWWRHPLTVGGALIGGIVVIGLVAATRNDDPVTSPAERERAIAAYESRWQISQEQVLEMAGGFCGLIESSDDIADYEQAVAGYFADQGLSFLVADATESMARIGQCEQAYFDIGGRFGECVTVEDCDPDPVTDRPSTPIPDMGDGGPAILRLDNGEVFEFDATCALTYEEAPGLSIRYGVFADDGTLRLEAVAYPIAENEASGDSGEWYLISVFDSSTFEELWSASSLVDDLEFRVVGSNVNALGRFFSEGALGNEGVGGEFVAQC